MQFTFRWYGRDDPVKPEDIRQIPGVSSVVSACYDVLPGDVWNAKSIETIRSDALDYGLGFEVVEGLPVHESIKLGDSCRDRYIENYIKNLRMLSEHGIRVICYNFMPVFGWIRTCLDRRLPDGSRTLSFSETELKTIDPAQKELSLPGWSFSSQREEMASLMERYRTLGVQGMWTNLRYFLEAVVPEAEKCGIALAIHPDDPPLPVFGLPRIVSSEEDIECLASLVDSPCNGITLCTGSLGSGRQNNLVKIAYRFASEGKIKFVHARNVLFENQIDFVEVGHQTGSGSLNMAEILTALHRGGFDGYLRSDHGRMVWDEQGRPGYGLYDRAMGITYLEGLWEGISTQ
ncbi:mannonate dehydratase [Caproicibacter sp.]|uniref:mannonate dehydratase n=1 Tax=Caproicibacter sp. TaxID=2814884 RepID=UPI003988D8EA